MAYYPRNLEPVLKQAVRQFRVVALTGARQTGKSTLLRRLFGSTHRYVTLDDPRNLKLAQEDPELFFHEYARHPLILDEIQYAPELLPRIKMEVDAHPGKGRFLLTGSQQFTLTRNLRESLAGRVGLFQLYPMAITEGPGRRRDYAARALRGSYPELLTSRSSDATRWYASYVATYIERDVQTHYRIERTTHFRDLLFLLAARVAQTLHLQALSNDLGLSVPTIKSWVKILEASQIITLLRPYHVNLGSRIVKAPKLYLSDVGLACYLTGVRDRSTLLRGPQAGALFENYVVMEVWKRYANQGREAPLYYYRTNNNLEVDLLIERTSRELVPCEIKLTRSPHPGMARPMERLREFSKTSIAPGFVVCSIPSSRVLTRQDRAVPIETLLQLTL